MWNFVEENKHILKVKLDIASNIWVVTWLQSPSHAKLTPEGWLERHRLKYKGTDQAADESGVRTCWLRPNCEVNSAAYGHILSAVWTAYSNYVLSSSGSRYSIASNGCILIKFKTKKKPLQANGFSLIECTRNTGPDFHLARRVNRNGNDVCDYLHIERVSEILQVVPRDACG